MELVWAGMRWAPLHRATADDESGGSRRSKGRVAGAGWHEVGLTSLQLYMHGAGHWGVSVCGPVSAMPRASAALQPNLHATPPPP